MEISILELQEWTDGRDPDSDWVMTALLVACPLPYEKFDNTSTDFRDTSTIVTLYFYIPAVQ